MILLKGENFYIYYKMGEWDQLDAILLAMTISNWGLRMIVLCYIGVFFYHVLVTQNQKKI